MRVSTSMFSDNYLPQINQLQAEQNQLQNQASSGLNMTLPEDNPVTMNQVLNLQADTAANAQFQKNISQAQSSASDVSGVLSTLQPLIEKADEIAISASNATDTTGLPSDASQVASILQQVIQLGNSTDANGNYIFGGSKTDAPPFVAATDANGNVTGVTYQGNTSVNNIEVAPNLSMTVQVPGANTTGSGPQGLFVDSRSKADVFSHLIKLQQDLSSGNISAVTSTDLPAVSSDQDHIIGQVSANGVTQSALESASNSVTQRGTTLSTQISNDTGVNLAATLTKLSQTQTAYQAALESGVLVMKLSILSYIQ